MDIYLFRDYIGVFAPVILFILTLFLLRNKKFYLTFFVSGFIFNNVLNNIESPVLKKSRVS